MNSVKKILLLIAVVFGQFAAAAKPATQPVEDTDFNRKYENNVDCLDSFLDTATQAGYKSEKFNILKIFSCTFCGAESPTVTTTVIWNHGETGTFLIPGKNSTVKMFDFATSSVRQNTYNCFVDKDNRQVGRAFYKGQRGTLFDDGRVLPKLCGKTAKHAVPGQELVKNTISLQDKSSEQEATLKPQLLSELDEEAKSAMNYLSYEKLKSLAKNRIPVQFLANIDSLSCKYVSDDVARLAKETQELGYRVIERVKLEREIDEQNRAASGIYNQALARSQALGTKAPLHPLKREYPPEGAGISDSQSGRGSNGSSGQSGSIR